MTRSSTSVPPEPVAPGSLVATHGAEVARYAAVGVAGMVVSVVAFAIASALGAAPIPAATIAFCFALLNNFVLNRSWTFRAGDGHLPTQWLRFVVINVAVFAWSLVVLSVLVDGLDVAPVVAQACAVLSAAVPNYLGQKLWSFRV